jgi:transposase
MYVILTNSRNSPGEKIAMADRTKTKSQWWTQRIELAMIFVSIEAANAQAARMKFNTPEVWTKEEAMVRLQQRVVSAVEASLERKEIEWHDDDWCEND